MNVELMHLTNVIPAADSYRLCTLQVRMPCPSYATTKEQMADEFAAVMRAAFMDRVNFKTYDFEINDGNRT